MSRINKVLSRLLVFVLVFVTATAPISSMGNELSRVTGYDSSIESSPPDISENEASSADETESPDTKVSETAEVPKDETTEVPRDETTEAPEDETTEAPEDETTEAPEDETTEAPEDETTEASESETEEASEGETAEATEDETTEAPRDETTRVPEDETAEAPKDETTEALEDETAEVPEDETSDILDDEQKKASERGRAEPISIFDILSVSGYDSNGKQVKEVFGSQPPDSLVTTKHLFQREGLKIDIRQRGSDGNVFNYSADCSISSYGPPYNEIKDSYGGLVEWSSSNTIEITNPDISELHIRYVIISPSVNINRKLIIRLVDSRNESPETPQIIYDPAYPESYVLTGTDSTMEYAVTQNSFEKAAFTWEPCTGEDIVLTPLKSTMFYLVRYKATADSTESQYKELVLRPRDTAPSVSYDAGKEIMKGLTTDMEYCIDDGIFTAVTEEFAVGDMSNIIDGLKAMDSGIIKVRTRANEKPASFEKLITLYKRLEPPTGVSLNPAKLILTGTKSGMQYKVDTMDSWYRITATTADLKKYALPNKDVSVQVRYSYTSTNSHSNSVTFIIPKLINAPENLVINYSAETISGFDATKKYQYSTTEFGTYSSITLEKGEFSISKLITSSSPKVLYIREAATADKPFSAATPITIPKRRTAPDQMVFVYNDPNAAETQAILKNVNTSMEYKKSTGSTWQAFTGDTMIYDIPTSNVSYNIRVSATATEFPSIAKTVTLRGYQTTPSCTFSLVTELISSLTSKMEYRINGGSYIPVGDIKSMPMGEIADSLPEGGSYVIDIRLMGDAVKPIGKTKTLTIYPRPKAPQNLSYDAATWILSGVSSKMQYREVGSTAWKYIGTSTINLKTLVNGRTDVQIEVRYKNDSKLFASYPTVVNLY